MHEEHFPLLVYYPGNPPRFGGPLARVLGKRMRKNALNWLIGPVTRIAGTDEMELLGMDTCVDDDGVFSTWPTGVLGSLPQGRKAVQSVQQAVRDRGAPIARRGNTLVYTSYQPPVPSSASMKLLASKLAVELDGHPHPTVSTLQVTTRCQAQCVHCSAERHKRQWEKELGTREWKRVIREAEALGSVSIVFTGGEPLLRPDIFELIDWVDKDEAVALMFSNGMLLNEENVPKLAEAGLWGIHVSLDSPHPGEHDEMRRLPGCFGNALEGLKRCQDAGIMTGISTYATPDRLRNGQVVEIMELAREVGVSEVTVFDVVPTGKLLHQDQGFLLTMEDKDELNRIEEQWNSAGELPHVITQAHINGPRGSGCYAGWCQFYVTAYGDVTPCDFTPLAFGNARDESVEEIWSRMAQHEAYCHHTDACRMQDPQFRKQWIDALPANGPFPYPVANFESGEIFIDPDAEEEEEAWQSSVGTKR